MDMKQWFGDLMLNVTLRMVAGKRFYGAGADCEEGEVQSFEKVMRDFSYLLEVFVLTDTVPFLGWLDVNGYEKAMKKTAKILDAMMEGCWRSINRKDCWVGRKRESRIS